MFGLFKKKQTSEPGATLIVPRIKHTNFLQALRDIGTGPDDTPLTEPLVADLLITYAFDLGDTFQMVCPHDCQRLGLNHPQVRQVAVTNLRKQIGQIQAENLAEGKLTTPLLVLATGNDLEACLLLLDEIWEPFNRQVVGEMVVAVPTRDLVYVTGSQSPEALQVVREAVVEAQNRERTHSLTRHLLIRRGRQWQIYAPQPPPLASAADDDDRFKPPGDRRGARPDA